MPFEPLYLSAALGLSCALLAGFCVQLRARLSRQQIEQTLLQERLAQASLTEQGLGAQLDAARHELTELNELKAAQQAELAAARREAQLLQAQRGEDRDCIVELESEREQWQAEL
ncbi:MAG TPA: DNA recombination protein RmuC, partial [Pseudomonas sp.]|nr:DNA recombination protein RmuC [Pseudomonas sp.]